VLPITGAVPPPAGALLIGALARTCAPRRRCWPAFPAEVRGRRARTTRAGLTAAAVPPLVAWLAESGTGLRRRDRWRWWWA
jgi:hypothetical protein